MMSSEMSKIEYRAVIKFLTKKGQTPLQIKKQLDSVYGEASPSYSTVKEWAKRFRTGQVSVEDDERPGRPAGVLTPEKISAVEELVLSDSRLKVKEISAMIQVSATSVRRILHDHLGMYKVSAKWVPKLLSAAQRQQRVACARSFLDLCKSGKNEILESIVTGDETMVLYYDPLAKIEPIEDQKQDKDGAKLSKISYQSEEKKITAIIFWDCDGILLIDFKERNAIIDAQYYATLLYKLRDNIREKRFEKLTKTIRLLHDNTPVHIDGIVQAAIKDCNFEQLKHPPYTPDMAPSDYYLFPNLKRDLRGRRYATDEALKIAVMQHFDSKTSNYYYKGIDSLVNRCNKCIETKGDYIEK